MTNGAERAKDERSLPGLVGQALHETAELVREEVRLARTELSEKVDQAQTGVVSLLAGGIVAFAGLLVLLFAAVAALANVVEPWLAAVIVGGVVLVVGLILLAAGRSRLRARSLAPERTMRSLQEDRRLAKEQMK